MDYEFCGEHRKLHWFDANEDWREYVFPGGDKVHLDNVVSVMVSRHGNHLIETADGLTHVIPWGWIALTWCGENRLPEEEREDDDDFIPECDPGAGDDPIE